LPGTEAVKGDLAGNPAPLATVLSPFLSVHGISRLAQPLTLVSALLPLASVGILTYYLHRARHDTPKLTDKDKIVLADFTNTTGDPVFDGTLRQGLAVQLEQSPFLSLVSERRIQQVLPLMSMPADARITPELAREICERTASAAVLEGSIASLGSSTYWDCAQRTVAPETSSMRNRRKPQERRTC
jgi:hypothetical protein